VHVLADFVDVVADRGHCRPQLLLSALKGLTPILAPGDLNDVDVL
jgi:hypothetical protein